MNTQSLLITFDNPPQITVKEVLFEDYASTKINGVPVFATVAPWRAMHDLLIDRETQTLAGIVYPVAQQEQAAVAKICQAFPKQIVRYCISSAQAVAALENLQFDLSRLLAETGDTNTSVKPFPKALQPYRQTIRGYFLGEIEPDKVPEEIRKTAADYFDESADLGWTNETARVEVSYINKFVNDKLPSYFPSAFDVELAQHFAEDIWFYREDNKQVYAIAINHLQKTLNDYSLRLPKL
ncbi:MAG: hypothetical protein H7Z37_16315 [Pyrinomonadaceae bacterium]|nr:hypothetical protein [Pyrinomonadaceae bacterium]